MSRRFISYFLLPALFVMPFLLSAQPTGPEKNVFATSFEKAYNSGNKTLAKRLLLRLHRKSPEQLFRYVDQAEELLQVGQRGDIVLEPLESDLIADAYRQSARMDPDNFRGWQSKLLYFMMLYPERYDPLMLKELEVLQNGAPYDNSLFLVSELMERSLEQPVEEPADLVPRWRRWVTTREHLKDRAVIHLDEKKEIDAILNDLEIRHESSLPDCESLNKAYLSLYLKDSLFPGDYIAFMELGRIQGCKEGYVAEDAPEEAERATASTQLVAIAPTTSIDHSAASGLVYRLLAQEATQQEDYRTALGYWLRSLSSRSHPELKAADLLEIADVEARLMNFSSALAHLEEAAELHPNWGLPYLHMADLYLLGSHTCEWSEFDQRALYWAAIDLCLKARRLDPSLEGEVGKRIFEYRQECPSREEVLFRGFQEGDTYPIRCWMQMTTTVKLF